VSAPEDGPTPQVSVEGSAAGDGRVFQVAQGNLSIDYSTHYHGPVEHGQQPDTAGAEQEPGWEYMLYGATLKMELASLDGKWLGFRHGHTVRATRYATRSDALKYMWWVLDETSRIIESLNKWLSQPLQEEAFGRRGEPGNASAIQHSARCFCQLFEEYIDLAIGLRSASMPTETERARGLVAELIDLPLRQTHQFMLRMIETVERIPQLIAGRDADNPAIVELTVTFSFDQKVRKDLSAELGRLKRTSR
jgi:hypothetical protein